jgi:sRNA-binding protein
MHQTTIRFAPQVWDELEREARTLGVSAAQYIRDATASRLAYDSGRRDALDGLVSSANGSSVASSTAAQLNAAGVLEGSEAVWAQARLARARARSMREAARLAQARPRPHEERQP